MHIRGAAVGAEGFGRLIAALIYAHLESLG
jgi:hypothetical protein